MQNIRIILCNLVVVICYIMSLLFYNWFGIVASLPLFIGSTICLFLVNWMHLRDTSDDSIKALRNVYKGNDTTRIIYKQEAACFAMLKKYDKFFEGLSDNQTMVDAYEKSKNQIYTNLDYLCRYMQLPYTEETKRNLESIHMHNMTIYKQLDSLVNQLMQIDKSVDDIDLSMLNALISATKDVESLGGYHEK